MFNKNCKPKRLSINVAFTCMRTFHHFNRPIFDGGGSSLEFNNLRGGVVTPSSKKNVNFSCFFFFLNWDLNLCLYSESLSKLGDFFVKQQITRICWFNLPIYFPSYTHIGLSSINYFITLVNGFLFFAPSTIPYDLSDACGLFMLLLIVPRSTSNTGFYVKKCSHRLIA